MGVYFSSSNSIFQGGYVRWQDSWVVGLIPGFPDPGLHQQDHVWMVNLSGKWGSWKTTTMQSKLLLWCHNLLFSQRESGSPVFTECSVLQPRTLHWWAFISFYQYINRQLHPTVPLCSVIAEMDVIVSWKHLHLSLPFVSRSGPLGDHPKHVFFLFFFCPFTFYEKRATVAKVITGLVQGVLQKQQCITVSGLKMRKVMFSISVLLFVIRNYFQPHWPTLVSE